MIKDANTALKLAETHWREFIRLATLIKESGHWKHKADTWGEFCSAQNWSTHRINQLANSEAFLREIEEQIGPIGPICISEGAVRELRKGTPEKASEALESLHKKGLPPTAKNIADEYEPKEPEGLSEPDKPKEPEVLRDETGVPLTETALKYWNRRKEIQEVMTIISNLKCKIQKSIEDKDLLWNGVHQSLISNLESAYGYASNAMPYSVCTVCQGRPEPSGCTFCGMLGILPKWRYKTQGDDRVRAIREAQYSKFVQK